MKTNVIPVLVVLFNFKEMDARYRFPVFTVESCPSTLESRNAAADQMKCPKDENNNPSYFCVPNQEKTALLEFCYDEFLGLIQNGSCLHLSTSGYLNQEDCHFFIEGCPTSYFLSNNIYKFPKCQQIDRKNRCFLAYPRCIASSSSMTAMTPVEPNISNSTVPYSILNSSFSTFSAPPESGNGISSGLVVGILFSVAVIIAVLLVMLFMFYKRWQNRRGKRLEERVEEMGPLIPGNDNKKTHFRDGKAHWHHHHKRHSDIQGIHRVVYEVLVRQYGNDLRIRVTTNNPSSDVKWKKDGEEINVSKNETKYWTNKEEDKNYIYLYIFDSKAEDSGSYNASWKEVESGNSVESPAATIHLEAIKLIGPNVKVEKDKTQLEKVQKMEKIIFPIIPEERTYKLVITEKDESTEILANETFGQFEDDDVRRLLHFGILLSKKQKIVWNNKEDIDLLDDIRKLMKHKESISVDDYKTIASELSGRSLHVDEQGVSFLSEDVEIHTMWALMQNHNTKETILRLFRQQKINIIHKYFRTPDYERQKDEICVVLCDMLCENFREFLIKHCRRESNTEPLSEQEKYELLEMKKEGYIFSQRQSTILQCAVYYSLMAGNKTSSCLAKYFRSSGYEPMGNEMCICLPAEYNEELIRRMDVNILTHQTISDTLIHKDICKYLHVPEEVIKWTQEQRQRFVENFKIGSIKMHRARGMIVGCAGAGKTTLLRRLQRRDRKEKDKETQTTIGLEVHDNIFLVDNNTLYDYVPKDDEKHRKETDGHQVNLHEDKKLLSITDFAGQVAYYACHQIYLSRRAFYILVVDMSRDLKEIPDLKERYNPLGSLFEKWTYEAYFVFWLLSIKTYCGDERTQGKYGEKAVPVPVILIASHHDCLKSKDKESFEYDSQSSNFYDKLENCLPKEQTLKGHISPERYFEVECPKGKLKENQAEIIEKVRACIVETATNLPQWGELIPVKWSLFEQFVWAKKNERILERNELRKMSEFQSLSDNDIDDMLRFYHEIGQIIYFLDTGLSDTIILDVQWFVDAFKNIITDPTHAHSFFQKVKEWKVFMKTGRISDSTLCKVWRKNKKESYVTHKDKIMPYMEKLGILAKVWTRELREKKSGYVSPDKQFDYYIPSINKTDITEECKAVINNGNKTPILVFYFKTYLPHFFFYRLVVRCFSKWDSLSDDFFCKNAAFYTTEGGDHNIAIAVNKSSIQLQVFSPDTRIQLSKDKTKEIRKHIEDIIMELTQTFHKRVGYETGYMCKDVGVTEEDEDYFLNEEKVAELETNERLCPNSYKINHGKHDILRDELLQYWYKYKSSEVLYQRQSSE